MYTISDLRELLQNTYGFLDTVTGCCVKMSESTTELYDKIEISLVPCNLRNGNER